MPPLDGAISLDEIPVPDMTGGSEMDVVIVPDIITDVSTRRPDVEESAVAVSAAVSKTNPVALPEFEEPSPDESSLIGGPSAKSRSTGPDEPGAPSIGDPDGDAEEAPSERIMDDSSSWGSSRISSPDSLKERSSCSIV